MEALTILRSRIVLRMARAPLKHPVVEHHGGPLGVTIASGSAHHSHGTDIHEKPRHPRLEHPQRAPQPRPNPPTTEPPYLPPLPLLPLPPNRLCA
jgi:hypothetical protein